MGWILIGGAGLGLARYFWGDGEVEIGGGGFANVFDLFSFLGAGWWGREKLRFEKKERVEEGGGKMEKWRKERSVGNPIF